MATTEDLLIQLEEYHAVKYLSIDRERRNLVLQILKQQQQTIREQKELIESLWAWAEEKDDEEAVEYKKEQKKNTCSENQAGTGSTQDYDASVYTKIM